MGSRSGIALALASAALCAAAPVASFAQEAPATATSDSTAPLVLRAGTPVVVVLNDDLSTRTSQVGDRFRVTVLNDVSDQGAVVIPKGTTGYGEVTFSTDNGAFGKPGILGISLRYLDLNGSQVALDGRYRQEGKDGDGAAAATMFAVGIFAGLVKGKPSFIPKGRELRARTGDDIPFQATTSPPAAVESPPIEDPQPATVGSPQPPSS